jgi:metal-responsive CopG/Arc/MetJ family transcriptional regulator
MSTAKIAITLDQSLISEIDRLVEQQVFPNRSKAIQSAIEEKLSRLSHSRLAREFAKLDPQEEKALAEERMTWELETWSEY